LWSSGGGLSAYFPRPGWQTGAGVPKGAKRCVPDVSLAAASRHDGYVVRNGGLQLVTGGTSCSCPAFAGIMALVVQRTGSRQGNPNPAFYSLGRAQYGGQGPAVFHDVVQGDSSVPGTTGYACSPGYDLATGLGSVDVQ